MRAWLLLLAGLAVWTVHFFALYAIASALPGRSIAVWAVLAATTVAVAADAAIICRTWAARGGPDEIDSWVAHLAVLGAGISLIAVLWQASPALLI